MDTPKCDPACYVNGRGCILSQTGQCLHIFKDEVVQKFSTKSYYTPKKGIKENKLQFYAKPSAIATRESLRYLQYKGIKIEYDGPGGVYNYDIINDRLIRVKLSPKNKI